MHPNMDISIIHTCDSFKFISFQKVAKQISNSLIKNRKKIFTIWQIRVANIIAAITPSCQSLRTNWFSQNRLDQQIIIATSRSGMKQTMWCHQLKMVARPNFPTGYYNLKFPSTRSIFCHHQRGDHTEPNLGRMS